MTDVYTVESELEDGAVTLVRSHNGRVYLRTKYDLSNPSRRAALVDSVLGAYAVGKHVDESTLAIASKLLGQRIG